MAATDDGKGTGAPDHADDGAGVLATSPRRAGILETIRRKEFVYVSDLSARFAVSEVTIRSDLQALADEGQIRRVRGGAIHRATMPSRELSFEQSADAFAREKERIGAAAAALVESGQTVFLDAGSTTAAVARALAQRPDLHDVHIFTNGLRIALELEPAIPLLTVVVTGGTLRSSQHSLVNPLGNVILDQVHAHLAFVGCDGIEAEAGATNTSVADAEIKRLVFRGARRRIVVVDGSKVGQVSLVHLWGIEDVDLLITDGSADAGALAAIEARGVETMISS